MRKIGIVVQRYGNEVSGGGEYEAKLFAERLIEKYDVQIITTTAMDYMTWDNYYEAGEDVVNGVTVHRFPVEFPRREKEMEEVTNRILPSLLNGQPVSDKDAYAWIDYQGPYCPQMIQYIKQNRDCYDVFIFETYLYYHTVYGLPEVADKALFIPTAHDEPWLRLNMYPKLFQLPRKIMYNAVEEREMVQRLLHNENVPSDFIAVGIETPDDIRPERFREKYHITGKYLAFIGRVDASKSCDVMINYFISYKDKNPSDLSLVLIGKTNLDIPERPDILCTGFVSEQDKYDGLAGAVLTIAPSKYESLCMALLEGMAVGVPAMANGDCGVLRGHCERSGAGIVYTNEEEFHQAIDRILSDEGQREEMGRKACEYVQKNYIWTEIMRKFDVAIDEIVNEPFEKKYMTYGYRDLFEAEKKEYIIKMKKGDIISPIEKNGNSIPVTFVSSDEYAPYLGVTLCSILENSTEDSLYDIIVLVSDMSAGNARRLRDMVSDYHNCQIRFYNIQELVKQYSFYDNKDYEDYTYYRLLIPELMQRYEKIIYLDCDIIVNRNIAELYNTGLDDACIAACRDPFILSVQCGENGDPIKEHLRKWDLLEVGSYFQGGVQLINPGRINEMCRADELLKMASGNEFVFCDQDVLNIICKGKIKLLHNRWNVLSMSKDLANICDYRMPSEYYDEYLEARKDPWIIHFADKQMPYKTIDADFYEYYWKYAKKTPFYELLLLRSPEYQMKREWGEKIDDLERRLAAEQEQRQVQEPVKIPLKTRIKRKILMPVVNVFFPGGSHRRERMKKIYLKLRGVGD